MISKRFIKPITRLFSSYSTNHIPNDKIFQHQRLTSKENRSMGYRFLSDVYRRMQYNSAHARNFRAYNNVQPGGSLPSQPPSNNYLSWILGIAVTIAFPFVTHKWGPLLTIKNEVDTTIETIEEIAEVVEQVAEVVHKVAESISDKLPGDGKLKQVVDSVGNVAEETAKDAHVVENAIDEFQKVEEKVEQIVETLSPEALPKEAKDVKS